MRPTTTQEVFELLDGSVTAAALGAALELGLFRRLAERSMPAQDLARELGIPLNRCTYWLQLLEKIGLLQEGSAGFEPTAVARETILDVYNDDAWAFLAWGFRKETPAVRDLAETIGRPVSTWDLAQLTPPDYLAQIRNDPDYAARFTRMLYEIHIPLAEQVAGMLDLQGARRMMDLGGGSGVVSHALLNKSPDLTSLIVDNEHVCPVGLEIAGEQGLGDRISYLAADFIKDELPAGFDLVMICDVGPQDEGVLRKIHSALNAGGRLVLIDKYAPDSGTAVPSRLAWAFLGSLASPAEAINLSTIDQMEARLRQAGFREFAARAVPAVDDARWNVDWTMIEAGK